MICLMTCMESDVLSMLGAIYDGHLLFSIKLWRVVLMASLSPWQKATYGPLAFILTAVCCGIMISLHAAHVGAQLTACLILTAVLYSKDQVSCNSI